MKYWIPIIGFFIKFDVKEWGKHVYPYSGWYMFYTMLQVYVFFTLPFTILLTKLFG